MQATTHIGEQRVMLWVLARVQPSQQPQIKREYWDADDDSSRAKFHKI